ncbi:hypothetical protein EGCR1_18525 (plasmid) [Enterococcus gilvus]|uniref:hypothetical protein n=1 Tax=Enterococcus gilvus TaxID=160453 RepID=UPI000DF5EB93|nr:hypothetical protein [Enterococcus gilvus]AXG40717.1 hypothetical protein EGCR1_18525 [Enterococcus gilvus]
MAIVQEAYDIPSEIWTKILTGEYKRMGGVVRHAIGTHKGEIVKHLKPIDLPTAKKTQNLGIKALQYVKTNKKALIVLGAGTGIALAGSGIYYKFKTHEPKVIVEFRLSLRTYLDAIRNGNLNLDEINNLMDLLEVMRNHKNYQKFTIRLSAEDLGVLVNRIYEYTTKLAQDNFFELKSEELSTLESSDNAIIYLQKYLGVQKRIFEEAK